MSTTPSPFTLLVGTTLSCALACPTFAAQTPGGGFIKQTVHYADTSGDLMGSDVAGLGDINGDGVGDYAICASGYDSGGIQNVGLLRAISGADGSIIHQYVGTVFSGNIGRSVASVGDVDGDGTPDFAFGSNEGNGHLYLASGATGAFLLSLPGGMNSHDFGESVAALGDVNGDTIPDFVVGDGNYSYTPLGGTLLTNAGAIWVLSGADGSTIHFTVGTTSYGNLGENIASIGDADQDGTDDFVVGCNGFSPPGRPKAGATFLYSGATGAEIFRVDGATSYIYSPFSVAGAGDINRDGFPDFLVGAPLDETAGGLAQGSVTLISGRPTDNGLQLNKWFGTEDIENLGSAVAASGDVDEDGVGDLLFGADGRAFGGRAYIYSGDTGERLWISESNGWSHEYGASVAGIGDIDSDGNLEILVGATDAWYGGPSPGAVYLLSFRDFATASATTISAASGGTLTWNLAFPNDYVHQSDRLHYRTLVSMTSGMTHAYGWQIPLGVDSLFVDTSAGIYPPVFVNPEGLLSANGEGTVSVVLPAGFASSLIGTTFHVSFASYELTDWQALLIHGFSRSLPLTILP